MSASETPSIYRSAVGEREVMARYDAMLARWPVPFAASTVATRHGDTFTLACGEASAPPLVLLHGAGSNSAMWAGDVAAYARTHRVFCVDLIGEPGKSAPNRPPWDGPAYAEWLEDVLLGLGLEKATIIGLSQGGWTALKLAVAKPERVAALVLLSPGGITRDKLSFVLRVLPLLLLGSRGVGGIQRLVLGGESVPAEVGRAIGAIMTHFRARIGVLPIFTDAELGRLGMPVQLLIGGRDALRDAEKITARLRRLVPQVQATILPEAGHALVTARPHVEAFLAALPRAA